MTDIPGDTRFGGPHENVLPPDILPSLNVDRQTYFNVSTKSSNVLAHGTISDAGGELIYQAPENGYAILAEILLSGNPADISIVPEGQTAAANIMWAAAPADTGPIKLDTALDPLWSLYLTAPVGTNYHVSGTEVS